MKSADNWRRNFATLIRIGAMLRGEGFRLGLFTDAAVWTFTDGKLVMDEMLQEVPGANCLQQLNIVGTITHDIDVGSYLESHSGRFFWLPIRDGLKKNRRILPPIYPH
ncbi:MAG: hypothetical protein ABI859_11390 [Pseudomonadota bacterium]